jgi:hypothetical protein
VENYNAFGYLKNGDGGKFKKKENSEMRKPDRLGHV